MRRARSWPRRRPSVTSTSPLTAAEGRVLAHAFAAPDNLPSERRSVMDGFAVRAADVHTASELFSIVLKVVGSVPMGDVFHGRMAAGEAVEIATGGFLPPTPTPW